MKPYKKRLKNKWIEKQAELSGPSAFTLIKRIFILILHKCTRCICFRQIFASILANYSENEQEFISYVFEFQNDGGTYFSTYLIWSKAIPSWISVISIRRNTHSKAGNRAIYISIDL